MAIIARASDGDTMRIAKRRTPSRPPLELVLDALAALRCDPEKHGGEWKAKCPAHDDQTPSLSVTVGDDGKVRVQCRSAGCNFAEIARALKLKERDFFPRRSGFGGRSQKFRPREFKDDDAFRDHVKELTFVLPTGEDCRHAATAEGLTIGAVPYNAVRSGSVKFRDRRFIVVVPDGQDLDADDAGRRCLQGEAAEVILWPVSASWADGDFGRLVALDQPWNPRDGGPIRLEEGPEINEADDDPFKLARACIEQEWSHQDGYTLRYYREDFQRWENGAYQQVRKAELAAAVGLMVKSQLDRANERDIANWRARGETDARGKPSSKPTVRKVTARLTADVVAALGSLSVLDGQLEPPAWLCENPPFAANDVLGLKTTLVSLPDLVGGRPATIPATPLFFSRNALPFDLDFQAPPPREWLAFLGTLWPEDQESIECLQEWFGYLLTPDTRQQKIMTLIGPRRAGKDTIAAVLRGLVGPENTAGPTFSSLATQFGLQPLIGKSLAIVSDARLSRRTDQAEIIERLLSISGEGAITIDRKHQREWTGELPTRFMLISNELPQLHDNSKALVGRLIILKLTRSFYGAEDTGLRRSLLAELPGILGWAIAGWARLHDRGHFLQPASGAELVTDMEGMTSPVGAFVAEKCEIGPNLKIETRVLFDEWKEWATAAGREPGNAQTFGRNLRTAIPGLKTGQTRESNDPVRKYAGVDLTSEAKEIRHNRDSKSGIVARS